MAWCKSRFLLLCGFAVIGSLARPAAVVKHTFNVGNFTVTKLCKTAVITAVNEQFPGPAIHAHEGDTLVVNVINKSPYNITIHWHGIFQLLSAWADGPSYVTQCPITPGSSYIYKFKISDQEGTLWWHAHSSALRATLHGAIIIRPREGAIGYPFSIPYKEVPILLGEWWDTNVVEMYDAVFAKGLPFNISDALTINGEPGDLIPCSNKRNNTFKMDLIHGRTYLLRLINTALSTDLFFKVAGHNLTVVAADASYTTPYTTDLLVLGPGQTIDALMLADADPNLHYYMAAQAYASSSHIPINNTTATAIVRYQKYAAAPAPPPVMPTMPAFGDTPTADNFSTCLTALLRPGSPTVPLHVDEQLLITIGLGIATCPNNEQQQYCQQQRLSASMNNVSFQLPSTTSLLEAHYKKVEEGVYTPDFPDAPPVAYDYTNDSRVNGDPAMRPMFFPVKGTKVKRVRYNATVEVVLQGTAMLAAESHAMHLHGFDFFVVAEGSGNYNAATAVARYNLVNPTKRNTISVRVGGWAVIRFTANNPGIWMIHCHVDIHMSLGMATAFQVDDGPTPYSSLPPPPTDLPRC